MQASVNNSDIVSVFMDLGCACQQDEMQFGQYVMNVGKLLGHSEQSTKEQIVGWIKGNVQKIRNQ